MPKIRKTIILLVTICLVSVYSTPISALSQKQNIQARTWLYHTLSSLLTFNHDNYWQNIATYKDHLSLDGCRKLSWLVDGYGLLEKSKKHKSGITTGLSKRYSLHHMIIKHQLDRVNTDIAEKYTGISDMPVWRTKIFLTVRYNFRKIHKDYKLFINAYLAQPDPNVQKYIIVSVMPARIDGTVPFNGRKYKEDNYSECEDIAFQDE